MQKAKEIIKEVKKKISPKENEKKRLKVIFKEFKEKIGRSLDNNKIILLGSIAKDTFLKGEYDMDIFVLFNKKVEKEEAAKKIFETLRKLKIGYEKRYAEHPYARVSYKGVNIDLVPAYKINKGEKIKSAVDRSIFHYEFVRKNLKEWQNDEVRALKRMLKNFGIYGADIGTRGFSGYLCELLIIKYGNLMNLLKDAITWRNKRITLTDNTTIELFNEPLVFIDPVDKYRNVASPVSEENLSKFILISKAFLKNESEEYFFIKNTKGEYELGKSIVLEFEKPSVVEETRKGQLKRIERALKSYLEVKGFLISHSQIHLSKKDYVVINSVNNLPKQEVIKGPFVWNKEDVEKFKSKHTAYLKDNRLEAIRVNKRRRMEEVVEDFIKNYDFPSYYKKGCKIKKPNKDLKIILELERKRYYLMMK